MLSSPVARVTALFVYPVKSLGGIALETAELVERGFLHDRRWMITGGDDVFITQRTVPALARLRTALEDGRVILSAPGRGSVALPLEMPGQGVRRVVVWHDEVEAIPGPPAADRWLSETLGLPARLVHMPEESHRPAKRDPDERGALVSFADAYPLLLAAEESLDELNRRLDVPLPMNRFRPNVVVRGAAPFAEDGWGHFRIGALECVVASPCARCVTTTTDQTTGERGKEPLRTLATFRREGDQVFFAVNVVHRGTGRIAIGDGVRVDGNEGGM